MSVNSDLIDAYIRHQVDILSAADESHLRLRRLLLRADRDTLNLINRFKFEDVGPGFRRRRLRLLEKRISEINQESQKEVNQTLTDELTDFAKEEDDLNEELLLAALLLLTPTGRLASPELSEIRHEILSQRFRSGRLGLGTKTEHIRELFRARERRILNELRLGVLSGITTGEIIRNIRGTAQNLFRDGILKQFRTELRAVTLSAFNAAGNAVTRLFTQKNQEQLVGVIWIAKLDSRLCPVCAARHGLFFKPGEGPRPPAHENCRCITTPAFKGGGSIRDAVDETFEDFMSRSSVQVQNEILGVAKAKLFRAGMPIKEFVDRPKRDLGRTRIFTLEELRKKNSRVVQEAFNRADI